MDSAWARDQVRLILALFCTSFRASGCLLKKWRPFSTRNQVCWGSQALVMTCATCLPEVCQRPVWRWITSFTARPRKSARWLRCWVESMDSYSPPVLARIHRKSAGEFARPLPRWEGYSTHEPTLIEMGG